MHRLHDVYGFEEFFKGWFKGMPMSQLKDDNVKVGTGAVRAVASSVAIASYCLMGSDTGDLDKAGGRMHTQRDRELTCASARFTACCMMQDLTLCVRLLRCLTVV